MSWSGRVVTGPMTHFGLDTVSDTPEETLETCVEVVLAGTLMATRLHLCGEVTSKDGEIVTDTVVHVV